MCLVQWARPCARDRGASSEKLFVLGTSRKTRVPGIDMYLLTDSCAWHLREDPCARTSRLFSGTSGKTRVPGTDKYISRVDTCARHLREDLCARTDKPFSLSDARARDHQARETRFGQPAEGGIRPVATILSSRHVREHGCSPVLEAHAWILGQRPDVIASAYKRPPWHHSQPSTSWTLDSLILS